MSALMHPLTRPEEGQYNIVGHGRPGRGGLHGRETQHEFLQFLLPLLGAAVKTVAVSAVTQLATNAIGNFVSNNIPTAGVQETGIPTPTYEEVAGGDAIAEPLQGIPTDESRDYYAEPFTDPYYGTEAEIAEGVPPAGLPFGERQSPSAGPVLTVSPLTHAIPTLTPFEQYAVGRDPFRGGR